MEPPFGNRATLIIALVLVLAMLGAAFVLTKIGEQSRREREYGRGLLGK